ncbi:MAG: DUF2520 domain-containing protein [Bacteroidales bacterium]
MIRSVVIIGAGNLGVHLCRELKNHSLESLKIYSRKAGFTGFEAGIRPYLTNQESVFREPADLFIIAVNDDNIAEVAERIPDQGQIVVHTSGSTSVSVLEKFKYHGVLYPLQTFSPGRNLKWKEIPVFVEASDTQRQELLRAFCLKITGYCCIADSRERKNLHISAVFVSNFVNHLFEQAKELTEQQGIDFSLLFPLIRETVDKIRQMNPHEAQTGPALRGDRKIIKKHLQALENEPEKKRLYEILSESIYRKGVDK